MSDTPTKISHYIKGKFIADDQQEFIESENPSTGLTHVLVPQASGKTVTLAIDAAEEALKSYRKTSRKFRSDLLLEIANKFDQVKDEFAAYESADQGKTLLYAKFADMTLIVACLKYWANRILYNNEELMIKTEFDNAESYNYTCKSPVGVCGIIMPWNYPLYMVIKRFVPCLAYGNTCVIKPSEITSLSTFKFAEFLDQNVPNLPAGVANFIFGPGRGPISDILIKNDKRVKAISFTGSSATGKIIAQNACFTMKKFSLECGGKNPAVIFPDYDLDEAVDLMCRAAFSNNGEICLCMERCYVHEDIYEKFIQLFKEKTEENWTQFVGHPSEPATKVGPLVAKFQYTKVTSMLQTAVSQGANIVTGYLGPNYREFRAKHLPNLGDERINPTELPYGTPNYFPPTIITHVDQKSEIVQQEVFGPICCVMKFSSEAEAIEKANDVDYGLAAAVLTQDLNRAHRVAAQIQAGTVWVNQWSVLNESMPFGGMKQSGFGREHGRYGEEFFTEMRNVAVRVNHQ